MSVIIDSDNNNVNITEEPINVTVSLGGPDVAAVWGGITGDITEQEDLQSALDDKVPYTGATGNVDLGEYELKAGQIELDTTPTGTAGVAVTRWNDTVGTIETTLKGGNVVLKHGRDMFERVVNKTGVQLTRSAYQAVRISTAQGQRLGVALARANNDMNSADTIGLAVETIDNNQEGIIYTIGEIDGINTTGSLQGETWADGDVLYLSPDVSGRITNVKPVAPEHLVVIGYVVYSHANNGKIYVKVMNGWELGELHDVDTTGATNGQVLTYNGSIWTPATNGSGTVTSISTTAPITGGTITSSGTIGITQAGAAADGYLSATDWNTFNNKQAALSLTTTGTSGAATLVGSTLNIPQYQAALTNPVTGTGTAGQVAYWSATNTQTGSNNLFWDAANGRLGVGTNAPTTPLDVNGTINTSGNVVINNNSNIRHFAIRGTDTGGWARVYRFLGSSGTEYGGLFANGNIDTLNYYTVGPTASNGLTVQQNGNGSIGTTSAIANTKFTVRGSGTTSSTTALLVQNSTPTTLFQIRDDGRIQQTISGSTNNTIFGTLAGNSASLTGANNTFYGTQSGQNTTTGENNTFLGFQSSAINTTGVNNTSIGTQALYSNTSGSNNTFVGRNSGFSNTTGLNNTGLGLQAGQNNTTGSGNVFVGRDSGRFTTSGNVTVANNSVYIGYDTRADADSQTNQIAIGYQAIGLGSNTTVIGNSSTTQTWLGGNLMLGTTTSGGRLTVRGSGTTSSTTALLVQNSTPSELFKVTDDGAITTNGNIQIASTRYVGISNNNIRFSTLGGGNQIRIGYSGTGTGGELQLYSFSTGVERAFFYSNGQAIISTIATTPTINASAAFQIESTTLGFLPPRVTTTQKNAIASPAAGLVVYDTTLNKLCVYTTAWETITSA